MVVTRKREKAYPARYAGHHDGRGWEIVKEVRVDGLCAVKLKFNGPEVVAPPVVAQSVVVAPGVTIGNAPA